jgi:hypothetical protein
VTKVLFVCVANGGRSVIAERIFKQLAAGRHEAGSAGSEPGAHAHAVVVEALGEIGIDASDHARSEEPADRRGAHDSKRDPRTRRGAGAPTGCRRGYGSTVRTISTSRLTAVESRCAGNALAMLLPRNLLGLIYVAIGIFVAASKDYFENLDTVKRVLSALLAIVLWPLLLLGIDLHIS